MIVCLVIGICFFDPGYVPNESVTVVKTVDIVGPCQEPQRPLVSCEPKP